MTQGLIFYGKLCGIQNGYRGISAWLILRRFRRQKHLEQRATLWPWAVADDALVGLGDAFADGQTQPGAGAAVAVRADQPLRLRTEEPLDSPGTSSGGTPRAHD